MSLVPPPVAPSSHHRRRIRRHALAASVVAPLVIPLIAFWLLFNILVCWGGPGGGWGAFFCDFGFVAPMAPFILVLLFMALLCLSLWALADDELKMTRQPKEWRVAHYARKTRRAYDALGDKHRPRVLFALEMMLWSAALLAATLLFNKTEKAWPLGVLVIAILVRMVYLLVRWMRPRRSPPPVSSAPGSASG